MKKLQLFFIATALTALGASCRSDTGKVEQVKTEVSAPQVTSPVNNNQLSPKQLENIKTIHATFSKVYPISLHETTQNFKRDQNPDREIQIWMKMVETYKSLTKSGKYPAIEQQEEVFSVLLASTMMPLTKIKADVELNFLSDKEITNIYEQFMSSFGD